jgi:hypothetical protein
MIASCPSLTKRSSPKEAIVRMVLKATVVNLEVKKPAGKWEKVSGQSYEKIQPNPDPGLPLGLGLDTIPGFTMLMRENKDRNGLRQDDRGPEILADLRKKSRLEHLSDEPLSGRGNRRFFRRRRFVPGASANIDRTASGHRCSPGIRPPWFYPAASRARNCRRAPPPCF